MGPVYKFFGLSVGYILEGMSLAERKRAYDSDITYVTAKEAGFDYLRSFLCTDPDELVQRTFSYAIIDEADSILIDKARIPLVIAGGKQENKTRLKEMDDVIRKLKPGIHFDTDEYKRNVFLTDEGTDCLEKDFGIKSLYDERDVRMIAKINCLLMWELNVMYSTQKMMNLKRRL